MGGDDSTAADANAVPALSPRVKSSLLWGAVGGLSFLVLAQGYELVGDLGVSIGVKVVVAVVVAVAATGLTHVTRGRLPAKNESP